jgi:hypothetical protein
MGTTQSYIRDVPTPYYTSDSAQKWMDAPSRSDKLHNANDDFFSSYVLFTNNFSMYFENNSEVLLNNYLNSTPTMVTQVDNSVLN